MYILHTCMWILIFVLYNFLNTYNHIYQNCVAYTIVFSITFLQNQSPSHICTLTASYNNQALNNYSKKQ